MSEDYPPRATVAMTREALLCMGQYVVAVVDEHGCIPPPQAEALNLMFSYLDERLERLEESAAAEFRED